MKTTTVGPLCLALPITLAIPFFAACGGGTEDANTGPIEGTDNKFVVSELRIPVKQRDVTDYVRDIDLDGSGNEPNNTIGGALFAMKKIGNVKLQPQIEEAVNKGEVIILVNIRATDLGSAINAGNWVFLGENAQPAPCTDPDNLATCSQHLKGNGTFSAAAGATGDSLMRGSIRGGQFEGGPGKVTLPLSLTPGASPIHINLIGTRTRFTFVSDQKIEGILAGGITKADMDANVLPAVHEIVNTIVEQDCKGAPPNCCIDDGSGEISKGENVLKFFNKDDNCTVSDTEFRENSAIRGVLREDLNLLNGRNFGPGEDDTADSVSFGLSFTAVRADYPLPAAVEASAN